MKRLLVIFVLIVAIFFAGCTGTDTQPTVEAPASGVVVDVTGSQLVHEVMNQSENGTHMVDNNTIAYWNGDNFETRYRYPVDTNNCNFTEIIQTESAKFPKNGEQIEKMGCKNWTYHYVQIMDSSSIGGQYWVRVDGAM